MKVLAPLRLFSARPAHPVGPDGRMALSDHLRELRARVLRVALVTIIALGVALYFFDFLYELVYGPYQEAAEQLAEGTTFATTSGAAGGLMLYLKLSGFAALVVTAPYWLYQIWAFILPGLHAHERKWTRIFVMVAGPAVPRRRAAGLPHPAQGPRGAHRPQPRGRHQPGGLQRVPPVLHPHPAGLRDRLRDPGVRGDAQPGRASCPGKSLGAHRPWIIVGIFIFAAVATPSADPFTMTFMAVPMVILFLISEVIARAHDRRKAAAERQRRPQPR